MKRVLCLTLSIFMLLSMLLFPTFAAGSPFEDVSPDDYFFDPVIWAAEEGITTGTSATMFSPHDNCTRAQVVTFLHRSVGCPMPMPESPFSDVTGGKYYYDAVLWAAGSKITTGTTATTFSPNEPCTRAQVVTFLWRTSGCPKSASDKTPFNDVSASAYYYDAILWAVESGITTGTSATTFSPDATCTRGQIVTFLYRAAKTPTDDSPAPEIVYQYPSYTEHPGELAEFWVVVGGGTAPYTYEWQHHSKLSRFLRACDRCRRLAEAVPVTRGCHNILYVRVRL